MAKSGRLGKRATELVLYQGKQQSVREIEAEISRRVGLERVRNLAPFATAIAQLSNDIHNEERRLRHLAALVAAAISGSNRWRTTPTFLSLINCNTHGRAIVPERTIQYFADEAPMIAESSIYHYLRMIEVLVYHSHPCCNHHVFQSLIAQYDDIEKLRRVFYTARHGEGSDELRLSGIMSGAVNLYGVIERMNGNIDQTKFRALKRGPLLKDTPYSSRRGFMPRMFVCARPSAVKGELVVSTVEFSIVRSSFEPDPQAGGTALDRDEKIAIYNEIYLPDSKRAERGGPVSVGYVVPREHGIYVLNHLQVDAGFNFSAFSTAEIAEERAIIRGVLLALNRGGNSSPAMTPVVMLEPTARVSESLGRDITLAKFREALVKDYEEGPGTALATELEDYLFSASHVEVETRVNGESFYEPFADFVRREMKSDASATRLVVRRPFVAPTGEG